MIVDVTDIPCRERKATKVLFAVFILSVLFIFSGCGSDGEAPTTSGTVQSSPDGNTDTSGTGETDAIVNAGDSTATGGMPCEWMTGVGVEKGSYAYLNKIGEEFSFSVYFKDRYGVYSGLVHNDNVHFIAEDGAATIESVTVENGIATAKLRTHDGKYFKTGWSWEPDLYNILSAAPYVWWNGIPGGRPSNGRVSVLWYTRGEEWFTEKEGDNLNDSYDFGEHFVDTEDDPYLDENENGTWDAEEPWVDVDNNGIYEKDVDTFIDTNGNGVWDWGELFVDASGNKKRDSFNSKWDADKYIFGNVTFNITYDQPFIGWKSNSVEIAPDDSGTVDVVVCDGNFNHLPSGATIEFSAKDDDDEGEAVTVVPDKIIIKDYAASYGLNAADQIGVITYPLSITHNGTAGAVTITVKASGAGLEETTATIDGVVEFSAPTP